MTALTSPGFRSVGFRDIGSPAGALQPVAGAIAWYRCDEGSGQILYDYSGNGNHGTLGSTTGVDTNDPTWNEKGLVFGGDDQIRLPVFPEPFTAIFIASATTAYSTQAIHLNINTGIAIEKIGTVYYLGHIGTNRSSEATALTCSGNTSFVITRSGSTTTLTDLSQPTKTISLDWIRNITAVGSFVGTSQPADRVCYQTAYTLIVYPFILSDAQKAQACVYEKARLATKGVILP